MQVEKAFEALRERAEGNILEAAQAQVQQRTEKLLDAVDVDKFVQGEPPELCLCLNWKGSCILPWVALCNAQY